MTTYPVPKPKRSPPKARAYPKRSRPRAVNRSRKSRAFVKHFHSAERVAFVAAEGCCVPNCRAGEIHNSHVRARGAGGGYRDVVPHCAKHHREFEATKCIVANGMTYPKDYFTIEATLVHIRWQRFAERAGLPVEVA